MKNILYFIAVILSLQTTPVLGNEVTILGSDYNSPKIYGEDLLSKGILVDIVKYIDGQMGNHTFNIELYPWARAYRMALAAKGGIIGLSKTSDRLKLFDYSDVIYYDEVVIVVLKSQVFDFNTINDLKGKMMGIGRGGSFGDEYEKAKKEGLFEVKEDNGPVFRLVDLLENRIDCALMSPGEFALNETVKRHKHLMKNKDRFVILPKPFKRDPNFLGFSKKMGMQSFLKDFNKTLKLGLENGKIQNIIDSHSK